VTPLKPNLLIMDIKEGEDIEAKGIKTYSAK
jgi:hypothetical protein